MVSPFASFLRCIYLSELAPEIPPGYPYTMQMGLLPLLGLGTPPRLVVRDLLSRLPWARIATQGCGPFFLPLYKGGGPGHSTS